ncbi:hypothetical protein EFK07_26260 [Pseudomonas putida]|uniref:Uncharacterized protein n=1 Tax=Pseudomonas putida TaxID=303 RepID=A0A3M8SQQ6_PSEPU|nr:hypothetical protein EFK07_26260 [Pseudomonas putida]
MVSVGDFPALWVVLSHREQCSRACHRLLWERACRGVEPPRSRRRGVWHRLRRCSRARPLPQGPC